MGWFAGRTLKITRSDTKQPKLLYSFYSTVELHLPGLTRTASHPDNWIVLWK